MHWRAKWSRMRASVAVRDDKYGPAMRVLDVGGREVELHIRRSNRVRGHRIVVRYGLSPELVVRPRATRADIDDAIDFYRPWLERQLAKSVEPRLGLDQLRLTAKQGRREARARVSLIAQSEAAALGVTYSRLALRDQVSRWGSCSSKGTLSFNWRLVLAPHDVLDYVVVHEVCHLVELNHSAAFWKLVERRRPAYRDSKRWLDEHGWEILAYRPPVEDAA
jgi:predicted metal-dependent hydrolase